MEIGKGEGCWLVVLLLPPLENRIMGRYRIRSDAEWHARKLMQMLGDRYPVQVLFDQEKALNETSLPLPGAQAEAWAPSLESPDSRDRLHGNPEYCNAAQCNA
jgi:hypothetical protein